MKIDFPANQIPRKNVELHFFMHRPSAGHFSTTYAAMQITNAIVDELLQKILSTNPDLSPHTDM